MTIYLVNQYIIDDKEVLLECIQEKKYPHDDTPRWALHTQPEAEKQKRRIRQKKRQRSLLLVGQQNQFNSMAL